MKNFLNSLNPGIRKTVEWLLQNGFKTTDSGDGETCEYKCDQKRPYVHMLIKPEKLLEEKNRLIILLKERGIDIQPMDENCSIPCVEAGLDTTKTVGILTLWNVKLN